jgi:DNA-binding response OmpR family regulator
MDRRRFDAYEIDLATCELKRDGEPVALQRQPARVLAHLVARAGRLVPREGLHEAIWGPEVHVDFDRGLNTWLRLAPVPAD